MTTNPITEAVVEAVARAICVACEENPDSKGDARGNEFRWQDYRDTALAAVSAFTAAQQQGQATPVEVEELVERMRQAPSRLWMADLVGQKISVERMRDILTFALAQQQESNDELA